MTTLRAPAVLRVPAPSLVLVSIVSVQAGSAVARSLFDDLGSTGVAFLRLALAALLLGAAVRPRLGAWGRREWRAAVVLGAVMAGMNTVFYLSLRTVPLGVAVTVEFLGPLLLAVAQARRALDVVWALLAASGVALLGLGPTTGIALSGLLLAFLAGLCWAGYILASRHVGQVVAGLDGLAVALGVGALLVLPFGAGGASAVLTRPGLLLAAAGVALLSSVLPYGLELVALRTVPVRVFGILMSLEPAAAALSGLVLLGQALRTSEVVAMVLVSAASAGTTLTGRSP